MSVNAKMTAIANAIRDRTGDTESLSLDDMAAKIPEVYEKGVETRNKVHWDTLQDKGNRRKYSYTWYEYPGETLNPEFDIIVHSSGSNFLYRTFYNSKIKEILKPIRIYGAGTNGQAFANATELETITLLDVTDYTSTYIDWLLNCGKLKHIRWNGEISQNVDMSDCEKLDGDSIYDTIIHYAKSVSGKTLMISQVAVDNATFPNGMTWDEVKALKPSGLTISLV